MGPIGHPAPVRCVRRGAKYRLRARLIGKVILPVFTEYQIESYRPTVCASPAPRSAAERRQVQAQVERQTHTFWLPALSASLANSRPNIFG